MSAINDFRSHLLGGGARPNQFRVIMTFPPVAGGSVESEKMSFLCNAASLPASTMGVIEIPFRGRFLKIAGEKTFETWTVTVLNDTNFTIRNAFERWSDAINNHSDNLGLVNPLEYQTDAEVQQLVRDGSVAKTYKFFYMFPNSVSAIDLDMGSNDQVEQFQVELTYGYWMSDTTN